MKKTCTLLAMAALCIPVMAEEPAGPLPVPPSGYDTRYAMPAGTNPAALLDKPAIIDSLQYIYTDSALGEKRLAGYIDLQVVYDIAPKDFMAVVLDIEALPDYMPYIMEASIMSGTPEQRVAAYTVGISFMGIKVAYKTVGELVYQKLPDGAEGVKSRLLCCPDGSIYEHYSSWYVLPVTVQGRTMSYVRYYNRPGISKPFLGMLSITRAFTPPNSKGQIHATYKEALKRLKGK